MIRYSTEGYLDPSSVRVNLDPEGGLEVKIYKGLFEICPDPRRPEKVSYVESAFKAGDFYDYEKVVIHPSSLPSVKP